jgi:glycosyltransferase involved in cell wall biosynthesis
MKIALLITGSGGSFYCSNCYRDMLYFKAIKMAPDVDAAAIPLYLPPDKEYVHSGLDPNVFFGAISLFLREKVHFLEQMPSFMDRIIDAPPLLKLAAHFAGPTRTEGLEDITLNMIDGNNTTRRKELQRLVKYLVKTGKPDIIHLSNALIIGLAKQLKELLDVKIVCSLQNEDDWINDMAEPFRSMAWKMIAEEAVNIDTFISPSRYFRDFFISKTGLSEDKIKIVPSGIDISAVKGRKKTSSEPAIGFFSRISYHNGFDKMVDAYILLRKEYGFPDLTLHVSGGYTSDDKPFIKEQVSKIAQNGLKGTVRIYPEFVGNDKSEFFNAIDLMSVPVRKYDGYGLYILESNAVGIPVVEPATGAFPEILQNTGGGWTYEPDTVEKLAENLKRMLENKELTREYGKVGMINVKELMTLQNMASGLNKIS